MYIYISRVYLSKDALQTFSWQEKRVREGKGAGKGRGQAFGEHRDREEYETTSGYVTRVTRKAVVRGCSERVREAVSKAEARKRIETGKERKRGGKNARRNAAAMYVYIYTHTR